MCSTTSSTSCPRMTPTRASNVPNAQYRLLRPLDASRQLTQHDLARELDVNLDKVNYCFKALTESGWIKARNFGNSKRAYAYLLTPRGMEQKGTIAVHFQRLKFTECESSKEEIAELRREMDQQATAELR